MDQKQGSGHVEFQIAVRTGIWELKKNGRFFGDYYREQPAIDAANSAIRDIVAGGGTATVNRPSSRDLYRH